MAELKIKKKKPLWPWVLLVLIILGMLFYILSYDNYNQAVDDELPQAGAKTPQEASHLLETAESKNN